MPLQYEDISILIPSHSLEDFPADLGDDDAEGLLNAFSIVWHPLLLRGAEALPGWHRSDEPPETLENRLVVIPKAAEEWLPGGWAGFARNQGATVVEGLKDRQEMLAAVLGPLESPSPAQGKEIDADLVADFLALGTCYLQLELLTTHMHHFSNLDEAQLQREAVAAAEAAVAGDETGARAHLTNCFEAMQEARERFYPVDCYLVDLCLLIPRQANEHLERALDGETPFNILVSGGDLQTITQQKPAMVERLKNAWDAGRIDVAGGELLERPSPLLPMGSALWDFREGNRVFRELLGRTPTTWGRRRFGFTANIPQILNKHGYIAALHVALDDGIYPDAEQSKIRWEGCDGTVVDAVTRIPLAAMSASSYLRFPQMMAESMEEDHVAGVIFARWPETAVPWFEDFQRIHNYAPVLGRFVTFEEYFEQTEDPGRMSTYEAGEYLGHFLLQSVAGEEADPIGRYGKHVRNRHRFEAGSFYRATAAALTGQPIPEAALNDSEARLETSGPDVDSRDDDETRPAGYPSGEEADAWLRAFVPSSAGELANVIMSGAGPQHGYLVLNSLAFSRRVVINLPESPSPPGSTGPNKGVQYDGERKLVSVELPPCGFAWVPVETQGANAPNVAFRSAKGRSFAERKTTESESSPPLAEENLLRNEFFELLVNPETGGIGRLKEYGRAPNRLSQQLAFRFPDERTWTVGEGRDAEEFRSYYSEMRCRSCVVKSAGPLLGELETTGELIDQPSGARLAGFRQTMRVWRGIPIVELDVELEVERVPEGDPWSNYIAVRFAYDDETAALTRSVQQGAQGFRDERFDSPYYLEIATPEQRTTILFNGQTFHRKTGPRMIDTLLIVAGETQRRFRMRIALDADYPMQPAMDLLTPPAVVPTETGPPLAGTAGWFFHVSAKNVQLLGLRPLMEEPVDDGTDESPTTPPRNGFTLGLLETEGRNRRVKLRCFRTPSSARQRDFQGRTISDLPIEDDAVVVEMTAHEIADVELRF
ncbi:MAG: hypothetical protein ACE5KM_19170 [Planctomycetaceae bacterium]